jgi:polar amino acid transport system substrate-binding protein
MLKMLKFKLTSIVSGAMLLAVIANASADALSERINAGNPIRLGFATAIPWAYPGDSGEPLGFVNALTLVVLEEMGITNYETSSNEWSPIS